MLHMDCHEICLAMPLASATGKASSSILQIKSLLVQIMSNRSVLGTQDLHVTKLSPDRIAGNGHMFPSRHRLARPGQTHVLLVSHGLT